MGFIMPLFVEILMLICSIAAIVLNVFGLYSAHGEFIDIHVPLLVVSIFCFLYWLINLIGQIK